MGRAGARQEGVPQLLGARARRELRLDLERRQRRGVRARQPQLPADREARREMRREMRREVGREVRSEVGREVGREDEA